MTPHPQLAPGSLSAPSLTTASIEATPVDPPLIWDLATRLFHWAAVVLVIFSVVSAKVGGNWMYWHTLSGFAVLALVLFRVLWGFAGSRYARFGDFVKGPRGVIAYLKSTHIAVHAGHNPLGALSVLALLAALLVQAVTGLFATDEIVTMGPLARFVSDDTSGLMTEVHEINEKVIYALVALHLGAIAYYAVVKRQALIAAMVTGRKAGVVATPITDDMALRIRAAIMALVSTALVVTIVTL